MESQKKSREKTEAKLKKLSKSSDIIIKLLKRSEFLAVSSKQKSSAQGVNIQAMRRLSTERIPLQIIRVGFTCSKKVGNAVLRNKAKRRLRHLARTILLEIGHEGWDYVLIGKSKETIGLSFSKLENSFVNALNRIHSQSK